MASSRFVSRGGDKLQAALDKLRVDVKDKVCLDVGSSTGGFVDCLLQNGAKKVYSVDTAYGELAWKLRNDPRVMVLERTNILHLDHPPGVPQAQHHLEGVRVSLITIDAGWTKLELVLPVVRKFLKKDGVIIALFKPHYEVPDKTVKGVIPEELLEGVVNNVEKKIYNLGFKIYEKMESPILGGGGNREFLLLIRPS